MQYLCIDIGMHFLYIQAPPSLSLSAILSQRGSVPASLALTPPSSPGPARLYWQPPGQASVSRWAKMPSVSPAGALPFFLDPHYGSGSPARWPPQPRSDPADRRDPLLTGVGRWAGGSEALDTI